MSLGATLSVDFPTFFALLRGICNSLVRHGFRNALLLNGHGGNIAALTVAVNELAVELDAPIATTTYFLLAQPAFARILEQQTVVRHACEAETSMVLALAPELVDMSLAAEAVGPTAPELKDIAGTRRRIAGSRSNRGHPIARLATRDPPAPRKGSVSFKPPRKLYHASSPTRNSGGFRLRLKTDSTAHSLAPK